MNIIQLKNVTNTKEKRAISSEYRIDNIVFLRRNIRYYIPNNNDESLD